MTLISIDSRSLMMPTENDSTYLSFSREEWASLHPSSPLHLSQSEIKKMQGVIGNLTNEEICQIYLPLVKYLSVNIEAAQHSHELKSHFLKEDRKTPPFIIGVAGSVAVGKSTTSRILQSLLLDLPGQPKVDLITTDGFLFPNDVLKEKGLADRKGFPESYDLKSLIEFLTEVKSGNRCARAPIYSHLHYDIIPNQYHEVCQPDIVIIEGINVLQTPKQVGDSIPSRFVSDFFDISIYVDAEEEHIFQWYLERFKVLKKTAFTNPESYFKRYADLSESETERTATDIWTRINKVNLEKNILPTKFRADLIIEKSFNHEVENIRVRKN
ncbi:type I pantothenate kinase [Robertmurraya massiliosenegalensis]|uniref:type I pantothenate kinase n=1 Tax=Robertmurraya massiliosenegalensis TaxID=1287657 RepID=UPI001F3B153B|nr:type I pantothenate kinase [Robertmurraya massiliosenegalensis]